MTLERFQAILSECSVPEQKPQLPALHPLMAGILQQMMQMPGLNPLRHFEPLVGVRSCHQREQNTTARRTCSHGRSQGLRRHVLQSYLKRESNCCAVYNYAKYHPEDDHNSAAMELPGWIYGREIELWMEACFGKDSNVRDATVSDADR